MNNEIPDLRRHQMSTTLLLGTKSLRLEVLDEAGAVISRATGFVLEDDDGLFLYTCWHVVTGVDYQNPHPKDLPTKRNQLRVFAQAVETRQPGVQAIGASQTLLVELYEGNGHPRWQQDPNKEHNPDLDSAGLTVPKFFDLVRIPIEVPDEAKEIICFHKSDVFTSLLVAGDDVALMGYPHGYSILGDHSPEPVFLKRAIASNRSTTTLLDGIGAPGMSGSPVITFHEGRWWLVGMYTGQIFPDYRYRETRETDRFAALGQFASIHVARAFMQVPGLYN